MSEQAVLFSIRTKCFRCRNPDCPKGTFVEEIPGVLVKYARQTPRLRKALWHSGKCMAEPGSTYCACASCIHLEHESEQEPDSGEAYRVTAAIQPTRICRVDHISLNPTIPIERHRPIDHPSNGSNDGKMPSKGFKCLLRWYCNSL